MKNVRILFVALLLPFMASAQGVTVKEGTIKMGKTKLKGFTAVYNYTKKQVDDNVQQNISDAHMKRNSRKKGFSIYKGASWTAISASKADYYYKVKSKKGHAVLYFAASKGYDNYVTSATDAEIAGNISRYLQNLDVQIATNEKIQNKEAELKKIQQNGQTLNKQQNDNQQQQQNKSKEIKTLKSSQPAAYPTK